jgi:hypothetical protein
MPANCLLPGKAARYRRHPPKARLTLRSFLRFKSISACRAVTSVRGRSGPRCDGVTSEVVTVSLAAGDAADIGRSRLPFKYPLIVVVRCAALTAATSFAWSSRHFATLVCYFATSGKVQQRTFGIRSSGHRHSTSPKTRSRLTPPSGKIFIRM